MRRAAVAWAAALVISCGLLALPVVALAATSAVTIQNSAFAPASVTVKVGDTVTWTNRDALSHTSTSDTGAWDTAVITTGASRSFTFASAGTFGYHCSIHAFMKGTVIVQAASTPPPPTAPPTPVRTAPPTLPPTAPPTTEPAEAATASPTASATTSPSVSPAPSAANSPTASASPSAVAEQLAPPPASAAGPAPLLIAGAAIAIVVLGAIAFLFARRS